MPHIPATVSRKLGDTGDGNRRHILWEVLVDGGTIYVRTRGIHRPDGRWRLEDRLALQMESNT